MQINNIVKHIVDFKILRIILSLLCIFFTHLHFNLLLAQKRSSIQEPDVLTCGPLYKINNSTWIDRCEITVENWLEYIYYNDVQLYNDFDAVTLQSFENVKLSEEMLPDLQLIKKYSSLFRKTSNLKYCGSFRKQKMPIPRETPSKSNPKGLYITFAKYYPRPIVGITYEQALEFCKWRTSRDSIISINHGFKYKFVYRLPTPEELDALNTDMDSVKFLNDPKMAGSSFNHKNAVYKINPRKKEKFEVLYEGVGSEPIWGGAYSDKSYSLHNIQGNVAEMTTVKGIAKGGSFEHYARECKPGAEFYYTKPESWLGFRCVATLIENK